MHVVNELSSRKIKTTDIYTSQDRQRYARNLPKTVAVVATLSNGQGTPLVASSGTTTKSRAKQKKKSTARTKLIPTSCVLDISNRRINNMENELRKLGLNDYANAIGVLFRVFIELSVDSYLQGQPSIGLTEKAALHRKMRAVADHLVTNGKLTPEATATRQSCMPERFIPRAIHRSDACFSCITPTPFRRRAISRHIGTTWNRSSRPFGHREKNVGPTRHLATGALMSYITPLRYPGGKRRLASVVMRLLDANGLRDIEYVEPYAGSSAIALALLFGEYASVVHINDLSRPVYAFWYSVLNDTDALCDRIQRVDVTIDEWHRQRGVYDNRDAADVDDLGFATLFLNRTNRSGIVSGGVIGGKHQTGNWDLDARFNRDELIRRIKRVGRYRSRIRLYRLDALDFTNTVVPTLRNAFTFYDPAVH